MDMVRYVSAILLAIPLVVFGGNHFLHLFELPPGPESPGTDLLQAMRDGGLMAAIAVSHVAVGILLVVPRTSFLGGLFQLPMTIGIVAFHATMLPEGLAVALVLLLFNLGAIADLPRMGALISGRSPDPSSTS